MNKLNNQPIQTNSPLTNTLTSEQLNALQLYNAGKNVFLSGPAGTGKTHTIRAIVSSNIHKTIIVTASTGIAAVAISGSTLHSFAGIGLGENSVKDIISSIRKDAIERWKSTDVLIIDEISMLSAEYFVKLNNIVKLIRQTEKPFGGIQLIISGDFLQLPPIGSKFVFQSAVWNACNLHIVQFTRGMRQIDDTFYNTLGKIRIGDISEDVMRIIGQCIRPIVEIEGIKPTKLYPTKDSVARININELKKLNVHHTVFKSTICETPDRGYIQNVYNMKKVWSQVQCMEQLPIAVGAQVMLTKNLDVYGGFANGSRGVVVDISNDVILVQFIGGVIDIMRETFTVKLTPYTTVSVYQFPLLLAWATTIHKSQGMTLDLVEMNLSQSFEYGMVYVALSRVRSLDGLYITDINYQKIQAHPDALAFYQIR